MAKMNDTIARQAIAAQRQGESLSEFFRAKGVRVHTGLGYLSRYRKKQGAK